MAELIKFADVEVLRDATREAQRTADRAWMVEGKTYANTQHLRDERDRLEKAWSDRNEEWRAQEESWKTSPSESRWYGRVIIEVSGETTYVDGYSGAEFEPDPMGLIGQGVGIKIIESMVKPTVGNEAWKPDESDD